jgi:serine/threonine protein kinase
MSIIFLVVIVFLCLFVFSHSTPSHPQHMTMANGRGYAASMTTTTTRTTTTSRFVRRLLFLSTVLLFLPSSTSSSNSSANVNVTDGNISKKHEKTKTKSFLICDVHSGMAIARLISTKTRMFFQSAIDDVELLREYVSEAMHNGGIVGGLHTSLDDLAATLDWKARNLPEGTTTVEAGLSWVDDRRDRRVERYVSALNEPLIGSKEADLAFADTLSNILPWIVDRKSQEPHWWRDHLNGRSEGPTKEPFRFQKLYVAAWIMTKGEALLYYPPGLGFDHPHNTGDATGAVWDGSQFEYVYSNYPEQNPTRQAKFSAPYPDTAVPGLSLITAKAPLYYTGEWYDYAYNNTYLATVGIDIAIDAVSGLLDELQGTMSAGSFAFLVDAEFRIIVISQSAVEKIYPSRTGFEESRVTYDYLDGSSITQDRRNQTYRPSDTILQGLRNLTNADWEGLHSHILREYQSSSGSESGYQVLDVTLTGDETPTSFYAMYERWPHVDDFILIALAPVQEVDHAIDVKFLEPALIAVHVNEGTATTATTSTHSVTFANQGTMDVIVSLTNELPRWIRPVLPSTTSYRPKVVPAGQNLTLEFDILGKEVPEGNVSTFLTLNVEDANYPDCAYSQSMNFIVTTERALSVLAPITILRSSLRFIGSILAGVVSLLLLLTAWVHHKRNKNDAVWRVKNEDLVFDHPPEIIGRGTFANVLLAEYRGTQVAVKRVIPPRHQGRMRGGGRIAGGRNNARSENPASNDSWNVLFASEEEEIEFEKGDFMSSSFGGSCSNISEESGGGSRRSGVGTEAGLALSFRSTRSPLNSVVMGGDVVSDGGGNDKKLNEATNWRKLRSDFIKEMRSLSKLRHPCITTVMGKSLRSLSVDLLVRLLRFRLLVSFSGTTAPFETHFYGFSSAYGWKTSTGAVIERNSEPMLVMEYMEYGSLYDLLHNDTMVIDGELLLPILRDVAQGMRFLHAAEPKVIHGDLKTQNILVDSKFRAKVADFGLSQKKNVIGCGTRKSRPPSQLCLFCFVPFCFIASFSCKVRGT